MFVSFLFPCCLLLSYSARMKQPYQFYAVVLPGLEPLATKELTSLSAHDIRSEQGGVRFAGTLDTLYRVSLRARCITRIQVRVGKCHAMALPELQHHVANMSWERFIPKGAKVSVQASAEKSKLMHTDKIAECVLAGIQDALGKRLDKEDGSEQHVYVHITNNRCDIRIDASGERLDRRGYRLASAKAPMRETLAAGVLQWMDWKVDEPLLVPMCGSGTLAIEAALLGRKIASNMQHAFPFKDWDVFKEKSWLRVLEKTTAMAKDALPLKIEVSDVHVGALAASKENAERAGVLADLNVQQQDVCKLKPAKDGEAGLIVCNPPYGLRIEMDGVKFYRELGHVLRDSFVGWRVAVMCPDWKHEKALSLPVRKRLRVKHGGLWLDVLDVSSNDVWSK
ncbi:MAG: RNA methyltransferase [Proteobacteria bacterium]|nr:MAG: RNA methyltransferase [Pseudomonadota bacterium]